MKIVIIIIRETKIRGKRKESHGTGKRTKE